MSLEKMKNVLSNVLSRDEMKEVMAGSGGGQICGSCWDGVAGYWCYYVQETGGNNCRCYGVPNGSAC